MLPGYLLGFKVGLLEKSLQFEYRINVRDGASVYGTVLVLIQRRMGLVIGMISMGWARIIFFPFKFPNVLRGQLVETTSIYVKYQRNCYQSTSLGIQLISAYWFLIQLLAAALFIRVVLLFVSQEKNTQYHNRYPPSSLTVASYT